MVTREDMIAQSVTDHVQAALQARGYAGEYELVESFEYVPRAELTQNVVAPGFNFDDQGHQAEMGSDLKVRLYTIEFFVFGTTALFARNLANVIKFALDADNGTIPLKDVSQDGAPEIDVLEVIGVQAEHQVVPDPEPWQEHVWTTTARVQDVYHASLV